MKIEFTDFLIWLNYRYDTYTNRIVIDEIYKMVKRKLDSLDLVNLVVATEQMIEDELGVSLTLADEKVLALEESPFQTIGTLVSFITSQVSS